MFFVSLWTKPKARPRAFFFQACLKWNNSLFRFSPSSVKAKVGLLRSAWRGTVRVILLYVGKNVSNIDIRNFSLEHEIALRALRQKFKWFVRGRTNYNQFLVISLKYTGSVARDNPQPPDLIDNPEIYWTRMLLLLLQQYHYCEETAKYQY